MESLVSLAIGIAWPVFIGGVIFYYREEFRGLLSEVRNLIARTLEFGKDGWKGNLPQQTLPPNSPSSPPLAPEPAASGPIPTEIIAKNPQEIPPIKKSARDLIGPEYRSFFDSIMQHIDKRIPSILANVTDTKDEALKSIIAEFAGATHLERATRSIFASQIEALETLKINTESLTKEMFRPYYEKGKQLYPQIYQNYTFDQWFQFLVAMELVSEQDGKAIVTEAGKVANLYMLQQRYQAPLG